MIDRASLTFVTGAVCTTKEFAVRLDPMTDDLYAAVVTDRCESGDRTLEAVENVAVPGRDHFE